MVYWVSHNNPSRRNIGVPMTKMRAQLGRNTTTTFHLRTDASCSERSPSSGTGDAVPSRASHPPQPRRTSSGSESEMLDISSACFVLYADCPSDLEYAINLINDIAKFSSCRVVMERKAGVNKQRSIKAVLGPPKGSSRKFTDYRVKDLSSTYLFCEAENAEEDNSPHTSSIDDFHMGSTGICDADKTSERINCKVQDICDEDNSAQFGLESFTSSQSSVMSNLSDDSSILSNCSSEPKGSFAAQSLQMKQKFQLRDKHFKRIIKGKDNAYISVLKGNEKAVRTKAKEKLDHKNQSRELKTALLTNVDEIIANDRRPSPKTTTETKIEPRISTQQSLLIAKKSKRINQEKGSKETLQNRVLHSFNIIHHFILSEFYQSLPGIIGLILLCVLHVSMYELFHCILTEATKTAEKENQVFFLAFVMSVLLARISGGIWNYVNDETYECVKFDMHNRLELQSIDARFLRWFRKHPKFKIWTELTAFYLCTIVIEQILKESLSHKLFDIRHDILMALPSTEYNFPTTVRHALLADSQIQNMPFSFMKENESQYCFDSSKGNANGTGIGSITKEIQDVLCNVAGMCSGKEEVKDSLWDKDDSYLLGAVSQKSYYELLGDSETSILSPMAITSFYFVSAGISFSLLYRLGVHISL